ncbi:MAG: hypothetical protein AAGC68_08950, partial [Verrucomicrobiota bacterium]
MRRRLSGVEFKMDVVVSRVRDEEDLERFQRFPWKVYAEDPNWVPPILSMERRELNPDGGGFFVGSPGSKAAYFLATIDDEVVGRIAGIRNQSHLNYQKDDVGFFGFFESIDEVSVARALLNKAEAWLREEGLRISRGPVSFTLGDASGVTIEGGDMMPTILMAHTAPYYPDLLAAAGYRKSRDLIGFQLGLEDLKASKMESEVGAGSLARDEVRLRQVDRKNIEAEADVAAAVFTESWKWNWGAYPLSGENLVRALKELGVFFDERFAYFAEVRGEPAAFVLLLPDPAHL